jgi:hypothetical protein
LLHFSIKILKFEYIIVLKKNIEIKVRILSIISSKY